MMKDPFDMESYDAVEVNEIPDMMSEIFPKVPKTPSIKQPTISNLDDDFRASDFEDDEAEIAKVMDVANGVYPEISLPKTDEEELIEMMQNNRDY